MKYGNFQYLWPPRPEGKIPPALIPFYQAKGWKAQVKKNGTCTVVFARGDEVIFKTRHPDIRGGKHDLWAPRDFHHEFFKGPEKWEVYCAELLHSKTPHIKDHLYLFDVLVIGGEQLTGRTFDERQEILAARFPGGTPRMLGYRLLDEHFSVAQNYSDDFSDLWHSLSAEDEGLVFKNPQAKLSACMRPDSNAGWQVKCRVAHKNYSF